MLNFDLVRTSEYVVIESKIVDNFKSTFKNITVEVDPNNHRETYLLYNKNEPTIRYQMQSQVRMTSLNTVLVYLDFPISFFVEDVRSTPYGHFDYKIMKKFCEELDIDNLTRGELHNKKQEYNKKYPKIVRDLYPKDHPHRNDNFFDTIAWSDQFLPEQYWSFMKYGQIGFPLIDRPFELFIGSSHSLFSAHLAKFKSMPLYIEIPENKKSWFMKMPSAIFSDKVENKNIRKEKNEFTYIFYIDLESKSLYGKKSYHINKSKEKDLSTYTKLL